MFNWLLRKLWVMPSYIANYGYTDGSGDWYIVVDSDKCDGCGKCVEACPKNVLEVIVDDYDDKVVAIRKEHHIQPFLGALFPGRIILTTLA